MNGWTKDGCKYMARGSMGIIVRAYLPIVNFGALRNQARKLTVQCRGEIREDVEACGNIPKASRNSMLV